MGGQGLVKMTNWEQGMPTPPPHTQCASLEPPLLGYLVSRGHGFEEVLFPLEIHFESRGLIKPLAEKRHLYTLDRG